ncbi:MAG: phosphotransferase [Deltaproteobacteria bacterium]|nr:phosphotransferase [Deltaproteobacteria bacterium]
MKSMILAAGYGTRLLPYTGHTPKPLFTIAGRPILDWMVRNLVRAGSTAIIINTHHLNTEIEKFLTARNYGIPVKTCYEPEILGTGGALKNAAHFWDDEPFMVVNSDIFTDIDLQAVYRFHRAHTAPATLVLCNDPEFNRVSIRSDGTILDFHTADSHAPAWTFTGIHVIDPVVLDLIPDNRFSNIIDIYRELMARGKSIRTYAPQKILWDDIGTPARFRSVARRETSKTAFKSVYPRISEGSLDLLDIEGDGSDRKWFRITRKGRSIIMVDHGIRKADQTSEADAFCHIGRHLHKQGVPVPKIFFADTFSGLVCMQDLDDQHLQQVVHSAASEAAVEPLYKTIVKQLIHMSRVGFQGFEPAWTWQSSSYDRNIILEKECRYFVESFLNVYLGLGISYADVEDEFNFLAQATLQHAFNGFMHRDFQSRNIMVKAGSPYFIDFQGGRSGPLQYDLASLLIDPYVALTQARQDVLLDFCMAELSRKITLNPDSFLKGYACCALTRNLQALGAFGYLSKRRGKIQFEAYIPTALKTLRDNLGRFFPGPEFQNLKHVVEKALSQACRNSFY